MQHQPILSCPTRKLLGKTASLKNINISFKQYNDILFEQIPVIGYCRLWQPHKGWHHSCCWAAVDLALISLIVAAVDAAHHELDKVQGWIQVDALYTKIGIGTHLMLERSTMSHSSEQ